MPSSSATGPHLAFDFGAESGRAVLAHLHSRVITTEEIHRFPNEPVEYGGSLHWDVARLWFEVRKALAGLEERALAGIGVDAWVWTTLCWETAENCFRIPITTAIDARRE